MSFLSKTLHTLTQEGGTMQHTIIKGDRDTEKTS